LFKVIEKAYASHPIRIFAKPGVKLINGYVGTLVEYNGNIVCDNCKPNKMPCVIIRKSKFIKSNNISFNIKDMTHIWPQRMIFRTDNFEHSNYRGGDKLFVGESGMLTNEPQNESFNFVARLISSPDKERGYFEALWI